MIKRFRGEWINKVDGKGNGEEGENIHYHTLTGQATWPTGAQSAVRIPRATCGRFVTIASALGAAPGCQDLSTKIASAEWI